ncbi:hypothetical protein HK099_004308 [Clydaea vesicula]|uniref:Uncharacterized protein n=1 Tax=Clydaea vesicula TaxID=447962 RepID=A0AAD5XZT0_9FUNG|nr:hypothetical protein HK099_004308 [Clydaea vesicula]
MGNNVNSPKLFSNQQENLMIESSNDITLDASSGNVVITEGTGLLFESSTSQMKLKDGYLKKIYTISVCHTSQSKKTFFIPIKEKETCIMGNQLSFLHFNNYHSSVLPNHEEPGPEFFTSASNTYFGPHFLVSPKNDEEKTKNINDEQIYVPSHFLDPKSLIWNDIWSTVGGGRTITEKSLKSFGNPYNHQNPNEIQTTSTLQSLVHLKKNTIKLTKWGVEGADDNNNLEKNYGLEFNFDASTECLVRVYCGVKEVLVVDTKTGQPKGMKNIIFRSIDNRFVYN